LIAGANEGDLKEAFGDKFTYKVIRQFNMLGASMEDRIVSQLSSTHVIREKIARQRCRKANVTKKIRNP
jgi:hypothetical protein